MKLAAVALIAVACRSPLDPHGPDNRAAYAQRLALDAHHHAAADDALDAAAGDRDDWFAFELTGDHCARFDLAVTLRDGDHRLGLEILVHDYPPRALWSSEDGDRAPRGVLRALAPDEYLAHVFAPRASDDGAYHLDVVATEVEHAHGAPCDPLALARPDTSPQPFQERGHVRLRATSLRVDPGDDVIEPISELELPVGDADGIDVGLRGQLIDGSGYAFAGTDFEIYEVEHHTSAAHFDNPGRVYEVVHRAADWDWAVELDGTREFRRRYAERIHGFVIAARADGTRSRITIDLAGAWAAVNWHGYLVDDRDLAIPGGDFTIAAVSDHGAEATVALPPARFTDTRVRAVIAPP